MGVPVKHEGGRVRVGAHVIPHQPVTRLASGQQRVLESAHLVQTVAGRPKDGAGDKGAQFPCLLALLGCGAGQCLQRLRNGCGVVIDDVVERAVHAVVAVQRLVGVAPALARDHARHYRGRGGNEVTAGLCDEAHRLDGPAHLAQALMEDGDALPDVSSQLLEAGHAGSPVPAAVPWESAPYVHHMQGGHLQLHGGVKDQERVL
mmetsp:Transcript_22130/g.50106  ORF Transcript_22130/g.50106 Transcript_22130/m.50106 type:complete len:204 (+) Transcript_22130:265-876(+)